MSGDADDEGETLVGPSAVTATRGETAANTLQSSRRHVTATV
jgi:hypothetical protein